MLASLAWLRSLCPVDAPADEVARALTARGLTVDGLVAAADDVVLDVDVPANRPDCLGHLGLAREIGAAFGVALAPGAAAPPPSGPPASEVVSVSIADPSRCARYVAGLVRSVRVGPSPGWVSRRLEACGLRSINNVVDASNLVMLELGQPVHFFDLERVRGAAIHVRDARDGERLTTLDGLERRLDRAMLVIADEERALALAGVIGGADSEIGPSTRDVLVEAAWFAPEAVRAASRRLGLRTDASHRFERGADPEAPLAAQALAARLLVELAGGLPAPGLVDLHPGRPAGPASLRLRRSEVWRLLGLELDGGEIASALAAVGLAPAPVSGDAVEIAIPSWRVDLQREADLVEEVARHVGYDRIPESMAGLPAAAEGGGPEPDEERARDLLAAAGFHESFGYAMIASGEDERFAPDGWPPPLALQNPIAEPLAVLRRSLVPSLLRAVDLNLRRGAPEVRLFEIAPVFRASSGDALPNEPARAALAWAGPAAPVHWSAAPAPVDLPAVAGLVEHLIVSLRPGIDLRRARATSPSGLHPGRSVAWEIPGGRIVGWAGEIHPDLASTFGAGIHVAEIDLDPLAGFARHLARYRPLPKFPAVDRDLSLTLRGEVAWTAIEACLEAAPAPAPARFEPIDRYEGPPLAPGEVSLTVRVRLEPSDRTLTEVEIEAFRRSLLERLAAELGLAIRGADDESTRNRPAGV